MDSIFIKAKPIWAKDLESEKNLICGFKSSFQFDGKAKVFFKVTASTIYRFFVNGAFTGFGPARGPHGFYRVDEWNITDKLTTGKNILAVEVMGSNINSYYTLDQSSFLQAEILADNKVIKATSSQGTDFICGIIKGHVQKVQRYSFQRAFTEYNVLNTDYDLWRKNIDVNLEKVSLIETEVKKMITRNISYPTFNKHYAQKIVDNGSAKGFYKRGNYKKDRSLTDISEVLKGYKEEELTSHLSDEVQEIDTVSAIHNSIDCSMEQKVAIQKNTYKTFDFGVNKTGFIGMTLLCKSNTTLYLLFDEILKDNDIDFMRLSCANVVKYDLKAGFYTLGTFDPYTMKYLKIISIGGDCELDTPYIVEYSANIELVAKFESKNEKLNKIYEAAVETFKQNSADIFMDCPSRERAGWLCDSYFMARVEYCLTGKSDIERNFLENFMLPEKFGHLPDGMLPMCYPSDHYDGVFIPNWALWFVIELEEYYKRSNDQELIHLFKNKVYKLFRYFEPFINEYGLLEKLDGWVFVEWSKANELVQDINFPSNMLYAGALLAAGRLFNDKNLTDNAGKVKETIRKLSYDGKFFVDNMVRMQGELKSSGERTEVCQYYAFFFDVATPEMYPELWDILVTKFGPLRKQTKEYGEIHFANAFIGNYLRLEILSRNGLGRNLTNEIEDYFYYMAEKTGTLWELDSEVASCNHGFASHVAYWLLKHIN